MAETDPYRTLGVERSATRQEIARRYRQLAKQHHPDLTADPSPRMARINEAWNILSSPARRARWDRAHPVVLPAAWVSAPRTPSRPPPPRPSGPPSVRESPWFAVGIAGTVTATVVIAMLLINAVAASIPGSDEPFGGARSFSTDGLSLQYPEGWSIYPGEDERPTDDAGHAVIVQIASGSIAPENRCVSIAQPCVTQRPSLGTGDVLVLVTEWRGGTPPLEVLDAGPRVGGAPAAFRSERLRPVASFRWQLSPPDFPDRWFEVTAHAGGGDEAQDAARTLLEELLSTLQFTE